MQSVNISAKSRGKIGKGSSHYLRRNHEIPGVIYGKGMENLFVEFSELELSDVLKNYGEHAVVNLNVDGKTVKTMIKDVQRNPVSRNIAHVDMKFISDGEKVHADVPVLIKGEDSIRSKGGIVQKLLGTITVETTPDKLPKYFYADVSKLNVGDKISVADMEFSSDITIAADFNSIIATITSADEKESMLDDGEQQGLDSTAYNKGENK